MKEACHKSHVKVYSSIHIQYPGEVNRFESASELVVVRALKRSEQKLETTANDHRVIKMS